MGEKAEEEMRSRAMITAMRDSLGGNCLSIYCIGESVEICPAYFTSVFSVMRAFPILMLLTLKGSL